jgi:hypothetical protein
MKIILREMSCVYKNNFRFYFSVDFMSFDSTNTAKPQPNSIGWSAGVTTHDVLACWLVAKGRDIP